jgi:hypothetical protein
MTEPWLLRQRSVAAAELCARWVAGVYAAREHWTPNFDGVQFTLGRAWYTHLEEERADDYFAAAASSDALVERFLPGLQAHLVTRLEALVAAPIAPRRGWCGPGVHVFPAGEWLAQHGGDIHFDTEGLDEAQLATRAPALSAILMLQPPVAGGGLRVWDLRYDGRDEVPEAAALPSMLAEYEAGELIVIDSYRLHQIQPFSGERDRISATAHVALGDAGWHYWF